MLSAAGPRTLVLNGSPHSAGNTMALARLFLDSLPGDCETLSAYDSAVSPCTACGRCAVDGCCVIDDSMPRVWEKIALADCIVIASPLHFTSLTAPLVALISRWQSFWELRRLGGRGPLGDKRRFGVVVATGGSDYPNMFECARRVSLAGFATLGVEFCGMLSASGLDMPDGRFPAATHREAETLAETVFSRWREA